MAMSQAERTEHIKKRANQLWERESFKPDRQQACWDKAVEDYESGQLRSGRSQSGADASAQ